jgi:hypothetical protein
MITENRESRRYVHGPEGMAVILKHKNEVAVVRYGKDAKRGTNEDDCSLPQETREREGRYFEPLPKTLTRLMREEGGIQDWKASGIKPIAYQQINHVRENGLLIRGHLVTMESPRPLTEIIDPTIMDSNEISSIETRTIEHILSDTSDTWRSDPDGRDLIRIAFGREYPLDFRPFEESEELAADD